MTWPSALACLIPPVLGRGDGDELFYVIAVLILSAVGALADRYKKSKEKGKRDWKPTRVERPDQSEPTRRTTPPVRPSASPLDPFTELAEKARAARRRHTASTGEREVILPQRPRSQVRPAPPAARRRSRPAVQPRTPPPAAPTPSRTPVAPGATLRPSVDVQVKKTVGTGLSGLGESRLKPSLTRETGEMGSLMSGLGFDEPRQPSRAGRSWLFGQSGRLTAADLRRYIVLSEVLQLPLALRENR